MTVERQRTTGVILAGGLARRMGGQDKGLIPLGGVPMVQYIARALAPQVDTLLVNANRNLDEYQALTDCPVIPDRTGDFAGPLAGMASAMAAAGTPLVATVPCDSPFVPPDLVQRLLSGLTEAGAELAVAHDGQRMQPVFALLSTSLADSLLAYLERGERKIDRWYASLRVAEVDLSDHPEAFLNVNTPQERHAVEARLGGAVAS